MLSTTSLSIRRPARSFGVPRTQPSGGEEPARATCFASFAPSRSFGRRFSGSRRAEGSLQTLQNTALAQAFDHRSADAQAARDVDIPEVATVAPLVRPPQKLRPTPPSGGSGTVDDRLEFPALRHRKAHSIELSALRVGQDPLRSPRRTPAGKLGSWAPDPSDPQESVGACTFGIGSVGMNQRDPYPPGAHACRHGSTRNLARILSSVQRFRTTRAAIEIGARSRPGLRRRLPDRATLLRETAAWVERRNAAGGTVDGRFTTADARGKRKPLYPAIQ